VSSGGHTYIGKSAQSWFGLTGFPRPDPAAGTSFSNTKPSASCSSTQQADSRLSIPKQAAAGYLSLSQVTSGRPCPPQAFYAASSLLFLSTFPRSRSLFGCLVDFRGPSNPTPPFLPSPTFALSLRAAMPSHFGLAFPVATVWPSSEQHPVLWMSV
jgi:hypothetical protein